MSLWIRYPNTRHPDGVVCSELCALGSHLSLFIVVVHCPDAEVQCRLCVIRPAGGALCNGYVQRERQSFLVLATTKTEKDAEVQIARARRALDRLANEVQAAAGCTSSGSAAQLPFLPPITRHVVLPSANLWAGGGRRV